MCGNISHKRAPLNENLAKEFPQSLIPDEFGKLHCVCVYTHTHTHTVMWADMSAWSEPDER